MIIKRFKERHEASDNIKSWKQLYQPLFSLIISKKASLYVIYDGPKPISISVNYHYKRIFFYYITAYDTNYSKFSLGNVMLYKQLEWSFSNNYRFFEMGWGDLDYKRWWSNLIYTFEHHFVFPKKSVSGYGWAVYKVNKTRFIAYLISKKVNKKYKAFKVMFTKKQPTLNEKILYHLEQITYLKALNDEIAIIEKLDENTEFLRPILYNYCYSNVERFKDIQLYRSNNEKSFVIAGKKQKVKIIFVNK